MESLTYGASFGIIGLMVVGAHDASMIDIYHHSHYCLVRERRKPMSDIINDIMPCSLPLISFAIVYWLARKVKPLTIIGGIALVGIFGSSDRLF